MVCSSVPRASAAGVAMLARGGNAVDAALAAAATLCVVEPMSTGIGGDAFALVWSAREGQLLGLNGSGRAPRTASLEAYRERGLEQIPLRSILAATVPGAVHAWETLSQRCGRLPLAECLEPAIGAAEEGFAVSELVAHYWFWLHRAGALDETACSVWAPQGRTPRPGEWFRVPALAHSLRQVAEGGAAGFYSGPIADAIVATSRVQDGFFSEEDLATHTSTWVEPIETTYRRTRVAELPPNGQGLTALIALNILENFDPKEAAPSSALDWHRRIEAIKLAFADRNAYIADPEHTDVPVRRLLDKAYAKERARLIGARALPGAESGLGNGDTVYLCAADAEGNLVSFIQSLFTGFGSGVGCGDTGIVLQSRGTGFRLEAGHPNALAPGKRPFHTIIPGMLLDDDGAHTAFGVMGGDVQPQGHLAFVANTVDLGTNPQEALDRARFRYESGAEVVIENPEASVDEGGSLGEALAGRGHEVVDPGAVMGDRFGGGQAVTRLANGVLVGGSDRRKDGCALGFEA
jgi:gamma-glutamyltranspeptidase/glutathione hydrolase